ncbi:MAG: RdgB/HAM1 family non-canonical purine NTP pyrophosphatase [Bacilli bacterium]|jgi:XTP/dITP diphosphohydrolase|nr:RdgB/HAM1 family non-canonical purine NTP pyrophosphatase [Bacilli bacterium]
MEKTIVFATHNEDKVKEVKEMLNELGYKVLSLKDLGLKVEAEEVADNFENNARIKAFDILPKTGFPVLADDSGLCVHALDGFPGVHSARFMEGHTYEEKCNEIIRRLSGKEDKKATFYTDMVFIDKVHGIDLCFEGTAEGEILPSYDKEAPDKFGYDPVFYSYDLRKSFGRATAEEKNSISHRGRALRKLFDYLNSIKEFD